MTLRKCARSSEFRPLPSLLLRQLRTTVFLRCTDASHRALQEVEDLLHSFNLRTIACSHDRVFEMYRRQPSCAARRGRFAALVQYAHNCMCARPCF